MFVLNTKFVSHCHARYQQNYELHLMSHALESATVHDAAANSPPNTAADESYRTDGPSEGCFVAVAHHEPHG